MAKYKNREVIVLEEIPFHGGDMVKIEHQEPGTMGSEIVPKSQVYLTSEEKKNADKRRQEAISPYDYKVQGQSEPVISPSLNEIKVERMAEANVKQHKAKK